MLLAPVQRLVLEQKFLAHALFELTLVPAKCVTLHANLDDSLPINLQAVVLVASDLLEITSEARSTP